MITLLIIGYSLVLIGIFITPKLQGKQQLKNFLAWFCTSVGWALFAWYIGYRAEKEGQIDALNNKYKYEQQIEYTFNNNGDCVKQDTIYVKIKK